jgi:hypothetical protein
LKTYGDAKMSDLNEIGKSQAQSIIEMVAALECDYERLEELRAERDGFSEDVTDLTDAAYTPRKWSEVNPEDAEELKELEEAAGDCESADDARTRIEEDALSVEVRGDWHSIDDQSGLDEPTEFKILLSTGGPASRIRGELSDGEPSRAWLEVQDWGTPWTQVFDISQDTLLAYARVFYFGES